jgi:hypothetical protein
MMNEFRKGMSKENRDVHNIETPLATLIQNARKKQVKKIKA